MIERRLPPRWSRLFRRPRVVALFSYRWDAHLVPGLIENLSGAVDGWIAWDDRGAPPGFGDEPARRRALLAEARDAGARWGLAVDPDERFERGFAARLPGLLSVQGPAAWTFALRELYRPDAYRVDGVWGRKRQPRLFTLDERSPRSAAPVHGLWLAPGAPHARRDPDINLYHLRMISPERRRARAALYNRLDPERRFQPIGYDYLADDEGAVLETIPPGRDYHPRHVEDGALWMEPGLAG
jgi:hypothetical protein